MHKVDARVTKDVHFRGVTLTGIAEVFNLGEAGPRAGEVAGETRNAIQKVSSGVAG